MKVTFEDALKNVTNPYQLAVVGAKRAVSLALGATPLVKTTFKKPSSIAFIELSEGKVSMRKPEEDTESTDGI